MEKKIKNIFKALILFIMILCLSKNESIAYEINDFYNYVINDTNLKLVGNSYSIGLDDLRNVNNKSLYCVALGQHLNNGRDDFIVDNGFRIYGNYFYYNRTMLEIGQYTGEVITDYDVYDHTMVQNLNGVYNRDLIYKLQYILCNNEEYNYGYHDYAYSRQNVLWESWNKIARVINTDLLYKNANGSINYLKGMDEVDANNTVGLDNNAKNFQREAETYANVIKNKGWKSAKANISFVNKNESNNEFKIKYTGIITGIYDGTGNSLNSLKFYDKEDKYLGNNLSELKIENETTELKIKVNKNVQNIKIRVASTDADLRVYHFQNKGLYNDSLAGGKIDSWESYNDHNMGQDLIYAYYNKSPDRVLDVNLNTEQPKKGKLSIKKVDRDSPETPIGNVWFGLETVGKDSSSITSEYDTDFIKDWSNSNGEVQFNGLTINQCYNLWEHNNNGDYEQSYIPIACIKITGENSISLVSTYNNIFEINGGNATITVKNRKKSKTGGFTLTKKKLINGNLENFTESEYQNVKFKVYDREKKWGTELKSINSDGTIKFENLPVGRYEVWESNSVPGFTKYNDVQIGYVTVTENNNNCALESVNPLPSGITVSGNTITNAPISITIKKKNQNGKAIKDVKFILAELHKCTDGEYRYFYDSSYRWGAEAKTNAEGIATFNEIDSNKTYAIFESVPSGYSSNPNDIKVSKGSETWRAVGAIGEKTLYLKIDGKYQAYNKAPCIKSGIKTSMNLEYEVENTNCGGLKIEKRDADTNSLIKGYEIAFKLYKVVNPDGDKVESNLGEYANYIATTTSGKANFENVQAGTYAIIECVNKAPGYDLTKQKNYIKKTGVWIKTVTIKAGETKELTGDNSLKNKKYGTINIEKFAEVMR